MRLAVAALLLAPVAWAHPPAGLPAAGGPPPSRVPLTLGRDAVSIADLQALIAAEHVDAWLLTDYRGQDDLALELVAPRGAPLRRWFYLLPATGEPGLLAFRAEVAAFDRAPGRRISYDSWRDLEPQLRALLKGKKRVAMAYSPRGAIPAASRVDAGTVELVRAAGAQVVSAGDLVSRALARWSELQRATHYLAMKQIEALRDDALREIAEAVAAGRRITEHEAQQTIARGLSARGLETEVPPVVAAGVHTADPAFRATPRTASEIRNGDLLRIEIAARQAGAPGAIYAAGAWMAVVGGPVPEKVAAAWAALRAAREAALALLRDRHDKKAPLRGHEVDAAARAALDKAGLGGRVLHATGHSLTTRPWGDGADLDDLEAHDDRLLVPRTGYALLPGVYLPGEFGLRAGVDVFLADNALEITGESPPDSIPPVRREPPKTPSAEAPKPAPAPAKP